MSDWPWGLVVRYAPDIPASQSPGESDWVTLSHHDDDRRLQERLTWTYGRPSVLQGTSVGRGQMTLANNDRRLDPTNTTSDLHGRLHPSRHWQALAEIDTVLHPVAAGLTKSWPQTVVFPHQVVRWPVADCLAWIGRRPRIDVDRPREPSGTRVAWLLDQAGWPDSMRDIDVGRVELEPMEREGVNILRALRDIEDAEDGLLYQAPSGDVTFLGRHHTLDIDGVGPETFAKFTVGPSGVPVEDMETEGPDTWQMVNVGRVELANGDVYETRLDDSIVEHGEVERVLYDLDLSGVEAEALAGWIVARFGHPQPRVEQVVLNARAVGALPVVYGVRPWDTVRVTRTPHQGGSAIDMYAAIDQVTHRITPGEWRTDWQASPWFGAGPWLKFDDADAGFDVGMFAP